jgi:membrane protease YdiL (CAAX protease family)
VGSFLTSRTGYRLGFRVLFAYAGLFAAVWMVTLALGLGINQAMRWLGAPPNVRVFLGSTLSRGGMLVAAVWMSVLALRWATGRRAGEVMFPRGPGWWKDIAFGLLLSSGIMLAIFAVERAAGWLVTEGWALRGQPVDAWLRTLWLSLLVNLLAAAGEEAMYRGFLLNGLSIAWGRWVGLFTMAVLFALPHILVAGAGATHTALFIVLLSLPGLMLGYAYLRTGSLWLPIGIHFAWNLLQDDLLNLPGNRGGESLFGLLVRQEGPGWIVGTSYGIEVGLAGVLAALAAAVGVWVWTRRRNLQNSGVGTHWTGLSGRE